MLCTCRPGGVSKETGDGDDNLQVHLRNRQLSELELGEIGIFKLHGSIARHGHALESARVGARHGQRGGGGGGCLAHGCRSLLGRLVSAELHARLC